MKKLYIYTFCFLFIFLLAVSHAKAESTVGVSPVIINVELSPGKVYTHVITISNTSRSPLPVSLTFDNFETDETGENFTLGNISDNSILSWVDVSPKELLIPANSKTSVTVTITVPKKVPLGGYYGVMFVEPVLAKLDSTASVVSAKVGVLMLANVGVSGKSHTIEFVSSTFNKLLYSEGPVKQTLRIKNTSINHFSAKPQLLVEPLFGKSVKVPLEEKIIFPGKIRRWDTSFELPDYYHGIYKTTLKVSTGNGKQEVLTKFIFAFPVLNSLVIVLIVTILLYLLLKRANLKRALRILFKGK